MLGSVPPVRIAVVGSINEDVTVRVPHLPAPGETVSGGGHSRHGGGKGANQAVAASRLGADVALVGMIGNNDAGVALVEGLKSEGVNIDHIARDPGTPTGLALIFVADDGENSIAVSPGANHALRPEHVRSALTKLEAADVTLLQLEITDACVAAAVDLSRGRVILNAAPARQIDRQLEVDIWVVNETELATLTGMPRRSDPEALIPDARSLGTIVIVTMGPQGAIVVTDGMAEHVPARAVEAIDTTAAGDAFCGALAVGQARGDDLLSSVRYAVAAGSAATLKVGAQPSLPYPHDVEAMLP